MSTVHVNRTLQELRGNGLITTPKGERVVLRIGRACKQESSTSPTSTSRKPPRRSLRAASRGAGGNGRGRGFLHTPTVHSSPPARCRNRSSNAIHCCEAAP